ARAAQPDRPARAEARLVDAVSIQLVNLIHGAIQTMFSKKPGIAAVILAVVGATEMGAVLGQSPGVARRAAAAAPRPTGARFSPAADLIYKYVKRIDPDEFKWQQIPWLVDLPEAIRQAKVENRPVLLWVGGDEPLERC